MLKDNIRNIDKYISLDPALGGFRSGEMHDIRVDESFVVDRDRTTLFLVGKGRCSFALSWRENENNREVLAVMDAAEGDFVLYLPGEPYTLRPQENSLVRMWRAV